MVTYNELSDFLEKNSIDLSWNYNEQEATVYIHSNKWDETIKVDLEFLPKISMVQIEHKLQGGKNIAKITRVTGFFSHVSQWNPGKQAELKDRFRIGNGHGFVNQPQLTEQDKQEINQIYVEAGIVKEIYCNVKKNSQSNPSGDCK